MSKAKKQFNTPTIFVVFGATGDLAQHKIFLALFDLFDKGLFPQHFRILGVAHSEHNEKSFRVFIRDIVCEAGHDHDGEKVNTFVANTFYYRGSFDESKMYDNLKRTLHTLDDTIGQCTNKLFHLAVSPHFYPAILESLAQQKLTEPCSDDAGWTRVLLEKPLGENADEVAHVNQLLGALFAEEQVYRIDHYLGKSTIQNILTFRFSNILFEPAWNCDYIESITINLFETVDVDTRATFYDRVGALRDVGMNHMLQMVALTTMEHPQTLEKEAVHVARARVVEQMRVQKDAIVRGQYEGYADNDNVAKDSVTETYFSMTATIDNERWRGVPITLTSGKALDRQCAEIIVTFKEANPCLCPSVEHKHAQNRITFALQPEETITVSFLARAQEFETQTEVKDLSFSYDDQSVHEQIDAYEKILYDAMIGDQMLFRSSAEVTAASALMEELFEHWQGIPIVHYVRGASAEEINKL